jgi:hypothetical protein
VLSATVFNTFNRCWQQRLNFFTAVAYSAYFKRSRNSAKKRTFLKTFLVLLTIALKIFSPVADSD